MRLGSLFSGYGGLDMAVHAVMGGTTAWVSDNDPGACKILAHRYPDVPNLGDITKVDWATVEPVDVIAGGFPCIDISSSGNKAGVVNGEHSGLWRHMAAAIRHLRPSIVVVENVRDLLTRGLDVVLGDLADVGYDARWTCLPACSVGAPFARVRLYLTAAPTGADSSGLSWLPKLDSDPAPRPPVRPEWVRRHTDRLAVEDKRALDRWAQLRGRPAPDPVGTPGANSQPRVASRFTEWLMGLPEGHVTAVPGLSHSDQLKALGNGVVPQQAEAALRWLLAAQEAAA